MFARVVGVLYISPVTITYLPFESAIMSDAVKGTFLFIIIAVPLDLELKLEPNSCVIISVHGF